jgi:hypothetical protein
VGRPRHLAAPVLLAIVATLFAPTLSPTATAAAPGETAQPRVDDVSARQHAGEVDVTFSLTNRTDDTRARTRVLVFLTSRLGTYRLTTGKTPELAAHKTRTVRLHGVVGPKVGAGQYAVAVCLERKAPGHCAISDGRPVRVKPARLSADPASLTLDPVVIGTSSPAQRVTLTNTSRAWTGRLNLTFSDPAFSAASTCRRLRHGLAPGAACTVDVRATPQRAEPLSGSLTIEGRRARAIQLQLSATGLRAAALAVTPTSKAFSDTTVGSASADTTFTVTNGGQVPSGELTTTLSNPTDFSVTADGCAGHTLLPGASCEVTVAFEPGSAGTETGTLEVAGLPGGTSVATLSGTGLTPAQLGVTPGSKTYDPAAVGAQSGPVTFTVTNSGQSPSGVPTVGLDNATDFTVTSNGCTAAVGAGSSCEVQVAFTPQASGPRTSTLTVSATPGGATSASLSGYGQTLAHLEVTPTDTTFPDTVVGGQSAERTFTVTKHR